MEITGNKNAETPNFVRWFEKIRHHYGHHTSSGRGSDPVVRILQGQTAEARHLVVQRLLGRDRVQAFQTRSHRVRQSHGTAPQGYGLSGDALQYDEPRT
jgi:hypothetical protein